MDRVSVYEEYCKLIDGIKYFHDEQTEHRFLTSKILLGAFAVVGVLLFSHLELPNIQVLFIASIIPFLAILIITINLTSDLIVKERLRLSCLSEAIRLEKENAWLPRFHNLMINTKKNIFHFSGHRKIVFYLGCVNILLILSAISLSFLPQYSNPISRLWISFFYLLTLIGYNILMIKLVKPARQILEDLNDRR